MVTAYPILTKQKSLDVCAAFVKGCGGTVATDGVLRPGPAFFFGVNDSNQQIFRAVRRDVDRDFYYADNAYFDSVRQQYFRIAKNRLQHNGLGVSDGKRFEALGVEIQPWREGGSHIVICPQSEPFMRMLAEQEGDWAARAIQRIRAISKRAVRIRDWSNDKRSMAKSLPEDLIDAHLLATWSSAAAVTALLSGVAVHVDSPDCCAWQMSTPWADLEKPYRPEDRRRWAGVLADHQFTLDELRSGYAWNVVQ